MKDKTEHITEQRIVGIGTSSVREIIKLFPFPKAIILRMEWEAQKDGEKEFLENQQYGLSGYNKDGDSFRKQKYKAMMDGYNVTNPFDKYGLGRLFDFLKPCPDASVDLLEVAIPLSVLKVNPKEVGFNSKKLETPDKWIVLCFESKESENDFQKSVWKGFPTNLENAEENNWKHFRWLYLVEMLSYDDWKWEKDPSKRRYPIRWSLDAILTKTSPLSIARRLRGILRSIKKVSENYLQLLMYKVGSEDKLVLIGLE